MQHIHKYMLACMLGLTAAACAVGPDFHKPDAPVASTYTKDQAKDDQVFVENQDIPGQWWVLFKSPQLSALVESALKNNPTLQAAEAGLRAAQENVKAQQGFYYPSITGNFSATRQKVAPSVAAAGPLPSGDLLFNLYNAQATVSYTPDVFGLNRRTVEGLEAQAQYQRFQMLAAYLTLTSNVVTSAIQEASLRAQIEATQELITMQTKMLDIVRRQLALGYVSGLDLAAQETQLEQTKALLPTLQNQLAAQRDLLTALAGRYSADEIEQTFTLTGFELPEQLPLSVPSRLIEQRPDVRAAQEQLRAANAEIGVAIANRLPQFNIDATGGGTGTILGQLLNPYDRFWSLAGGIAQPIFDGGTLLHKERAARALYEQAQAQYKATVINALQNVADTMHALKSDADTLKNAEDARNSASRTLALTTAQYKLGYIGYLGLLSAEQAYGQAGIALAQAKASRLADTAALFDALGGGWWNRKEYEMNN